MPILSEEEILKIKNSLPLQLGSTIKMARQKKKISQTELAVMTHKDRQYIYKIETGEVTPNIVTIAIIAKALDICIGDLLQEL